MLPEHARGATAPTQTLSALHVRCRRVVDVGVTMTTRDDVILRSVVHRVETRATQPVVLIRNPYGEPLTRSLPVVPLLDAGFAVVVQDCRGTGESDGVFEPFAAEEQDTLDAIAWCAQLPISNGVVVMYGQSYSGMVQLAAAVDSPASLAGIIPFVAPADYHSGVAYRGGALQLGQLAGWYTMKTAQQLAYQARAGQDVAELSARFAEHARAVWSSIERAPLAQTPVLSEVMPAWSAWTRTDERTGFWTDIGYRDRRSAISVPGLHIGGWFDLFLGGTIDNFVTVREQASTPYTRSEQRLVIGPWQHTDQTGNIGDRSFGAQASWAGAGMDARIAGFALAAAKGDPIPGAPVRIFVMGADVWRDEQEWPLARTDWTPWYLHPEGRLTPAPPTADHASTEYVHDPGDPVPMIGGQTGVSSGGIDGGNEWTAGPRDQRPLDGRDDIIRFESGPLAHDLEVTGPVSVILHASTTADDADFVARLVDVAPDGRALGVVDGIVRGKFRDGTGRVEPLEPETPHAFRIDLWATSWVFPAGHRLRVDVASSSYPNWDPNDGTLTAPGDRVVRTGRPSVQTVYHDRLRPSHILLPVIPA